MRDYKKERETFGKISMLYEKARISYPQALIDEIGTLTSIYNPIITIIIIKNIN